MRGENRYCACGCGRHADTVVKTRGQRLAMAYGCALERRDRKRAA